MPALGEHHANFQAAYGHYHYENANAALRPSCELAQHSDQANQADVDDVVYVTGHTDSSTFNGHATSGSFDVFLMKLDSNGDQVWSLVFGTASADYAYGIKAKWAASGPWVLIHHGLS